MALSFVTEPASSGPFNYRIVAEDGINFTNWQVNFLESPRVISAQLASTQQSLCNNPDGSAFINSIFVNNVAVGNLNSGFEIDWSENINMANILSNDLSIENKVAGNYYARVTEISSGCRSEVYTIEIQDGTKVSLDK